MHQEDYEELDSGFQSELNNLFVAEEKTVKELMQEHGPSHKLKMLERRIRDKRSSVKLPQR